jgi:hypothetical protein
VNGGGDPLALGLDHRQQSSRRVDESGEVEPGQPGTNDPPVERQVATICRHHRGGQVGEVDPVAGCVDDSVDPLLGSVHEMDAATAERVDRGLDDDVAAAHGRQELGGDDRDPFDGPVGGQGPGRRARSERAGTRKP